MWGKTAAREGLLVLVVGVMSLGVPPHTAHAADASIDKVAGLEEIVVTARRREEDLQTVPIAITVVSQQALEDNNVMTLGELQYLIPSMSQTTGETRNGLNITIRGQGVNSVSSRAGVVTYENEVPLPSLSSGETPGGPGLLFDLENVQVLKGPQGTLFGQSSVGGDILLQTARPTNDFGGHMQVGYGNYNDREFDGAINLPIVSDVLLARVAVNGQVRDGFTHLLGDPLHPNGTDADDRDFYSARGTLTFRPTDAFQNDLILTYSNYESHGSPFILSNLNPSGLSAAFFPGIVASFAQQQAMGVRTILPIDTSIASSGNNLLLNNISRLAVTDTLTLRNIFGYDKANAYTALDADGTIYPLVNLPSTPRHDVAQQYSDELQLLGDTFNHRFQWIVGAFFLDSESPDDFLVQTATELGFPADSEGKSGARSSAAFAQGNYDLSDLITGLKLTAGVRNSWDKETNDTRGAGLGTVCTPPTVNCDITTSLEATSHALTWTAGLDYQVAASSLVYLQAHRGYRPGGFNGADQPGFGPEFVTDTELGLKSDWKIGSVPIRTNADVYYQNYQDIQLGALTLTDAGFATITANAASAKLWGSELEMIADLTNDLQVGASFSSVHLQYSEFGAGVPPATVATLEEARNGGRVPIKYGLNARYHLPLAAQLGKISIGGNWSWQAGSGDFTVPGGSIGSYGLLNLSADWNGVGGSPWDVSLFASNVTDKVYSLGGLPANIYTALGFQVQRYGEPRMYGVRLRYRFGAEVKK